LSSVLPLINIYVCTKFNFDLFGTFQDMTSIMKNTWLWGDNSVNIQGRIMVLVHFPSYLLTFIYLLTKFHFNPFSTLKDMVWTCIRYEKWL